MVAVSSKTRQKVKANKSEVRRKLRESRNYDPLVHLKKDAQRSRGRASLETKEGYRKRVKLYEEFLISEGLQPAGFKIEEKYPAPTLEGLKRFIRWYIASTKGRIDDTPTMRTVLIRTQEFVPGFYLVTGNKIPSQDTEELYFWIQNTLTAEKVINDIRKNKYNFTKRDFIRLMTSFWVLDNPVFLHGRHKIQIPFITKIYLFTGARIGAFLPASKHQKERGLRYKHIQLVLFRTRSKAPWKLGWRLDQQWVKNNRNSTYTVFSLALWEHEKPLFSAANELLALAFLDHALFGYNSPEELFEQRIPEGEDELPLRWRDDALERCIVRNISGDQVTEDPLTKEVFSRTFHQIANNAGYFQTPTIHAMRRALGKQINKHYSSAMVAQVLTQKTDAVYGRDYVAHCSSISTVDEVCEEEEDTSHIDYFQSYAQFYAAGLPRKLLAIHEEEVERDPELIVLKQQISKLNGKEDGTDGTGTLVDLKREYGVTKARLRASALQQYQTNWVQEQRDWKILTRGKLRPEHLDRTGCTRILCKVMPEQGRLAATMSANEPLQYDEKLTVIMDLYIHGNRNFDVVYRPGEYPVDGLCPDLTCKKNISGFEKAQRNSHIHNCLRKATSLTWAKSVHYCWECFKLCDEDTYHLHCQNHVSSMTETAGIYYEAFTYRNTLLKPAYCIFCLWNGSLDARSRMRPFSRSCGFRQSHLEPHINDMKWPAVCPDGSCGKTFNDEQDFRRHLHDVHTYHKSIWQSPASISNKAGTSEPKKRAVPCTRRAAVQSCHPQPTATSTNKAQNPRFIFWQPPAKQDAGPTSTPASVSPHPVRHVTVHQSPLYERKAYSANGPALLLQDVGPEYLDSSPPLSQPGTPELSETSSVSSLSDFTSSTPNELSIDSQILGDGEIPEMGDHNVRLCLSAGERGWKSSGDAPIPAYSEAEALRLDERLLAKQPSDCMGLESDSCPNPEDSRRPSATKNRLSRLSESIVESDIPQETTNFDIKVRRPFTRARAREEAARNTSKKGQKPRTGLRSAKLTAEEDLFLKEMTKKASSEEEIVKEFLEKFPSRSKSFLQRNWIKVQPLSQRMTRSRAIR